MNTRNFYNVFTFVEKPGSMKNTLYAAALLFLSLNAYSLKPQTISYQNWVNSTWLDSLTESFGYDDNGHLAKKIQQQWNAQRQIWVNKRQENYTYTSDSSVQKRLVQLWDTVQAVWLNSEMVTDSFIDSSRISVSFTQVWANGTWQNETRISNTYNKRGLVVRTLKQKWNAVASVWVNAVRADYTNNRKGLMDHWIGQGWDTVKHVWSKNREGRTNMVYDESFRCLGNVSQIRLNGHWRDNTRSIISYNAKGDKSSVVAQVWDVASNSWIETWHLDYNYKQEGPLNYYISERWNKADSDPRSKQKISYTYFQ